MTKRLQFGFLILILIVPLAFLGPILRDHFYTQLNQAIDEFYSPGNYTSNSIADARQRQIFVAQLEPKNRLIQRLGSKYEIQEIWIDKMVKIKYQGTYPNQRMQIVPLGSYRLMIQVKQPINTEHNIVCNDSIKINGWQSEKVRFAEIQAPLLASVHCKITELRTRI